MSESTPESQLFVGGGGLDDTFILMSSAEFDSDPFLIRHSLPQDVVLNDYSQQTKVPKSGEQEPGPSTSRTGPTNGGATANDPVGIGEDGLNPVEQGADQSVGAGSGSGQPPDGGGEGDGSGLIFGADGADESHEQQSGESTTTSGSMPELVAPPPEPFLIPLLYPAAPISSPDGPSIEVDHSDDSRASEATTAPMVSDNEGPDHQQQPGVHVVAMTNISSTSTSSTNTVLSSSSSSSSALVKQPSEYLDTTLSSMSTLTTSTSSSSAKAEKGKNVSDSSGHLDASKDEKSFDVSKTSNLSESGTDILSQDLFCGQDEFFVSTPATATAASRLPFNIEEESDSEFLIPPSPTEAIAAAVNPTEQLAATEEARPEKKARKRPVELTLDTNPPSAEDLHLVGPSRRATAVMAVKAKIGDFLIKSMQSTGVAPVADVVSDEALGSEVDIIPAAASSSRKRQGAPSEDVEPSAKVIRKIAFESQTSSDESAHLSAATSIDRATVPKTRSDKNADGTSSAPQRKKLPSGLVIGFPSEDTSPDEPSGVGKLSDSYKDASSKSLAVVGDFFPTVSVDPDSQTMTLNTDDTEEDEVAVEQLILRYSPSQTAESQYFPLVSESCTSDSEKQSTFSPVKVNLRLGVDSPAIVVEESSQSDAVPSFNLQRPRSETPSLSEGMSFEKIDSSVRFETPKVEAVPEKRSKPLVFDEGISDEENPFESHTHQGEPKDDLVDNTDTPVCPVGRHKRKHNWSDVSDESSASTSKRRKPETKSFGCQVDVTELALDAVLRKESGKSVESAVGVDEVIGTSNVSKVKSGGGDERDGANKDDVVIRRTVVVKRFVTEELVLRNKVVAKKHYEEEEEPVVKEHRGGSGGGVADFDSFIRPTPPNKISPEGSGSSKSTISLKSSSSSSGVMGDISSLSKSSSSSKKNSNEDSTTKLTGDMRTLRSVRRRKCYEARKSLKLSESDSTPEEKDSAYKDSDDHITKSTNKQSPVRKRGRPKSTGSRASAKSEMKLDYKTADSKTVASGEPSIAGPSTLSVDHSKERGLNESSTTQKGVRVMAKWRDGYFYPCRILENESDNRVKIQYADGDIRSVKESDILRVDVLPVGQSVYVMSPDNYYDSSIITDSFNEDNSIGYVVETDSGAVRRVSRDEVILTPDQAACMENVTCTPPLRMGSAISLDNLVEGKRRTRGFSPSASSSPRTPRSSRTPRHLRMDVINEDVTEMDHCGDTVGSNVVASSGKGDSSAKSETGKLRKSK